MGGGGGEYGRREEKGREAGFPMGREPGKNGEKFCNIVKHFTIEIDQRGANPTRGGGDVGLKGAGGGSFRPSVSPHLV